MNITKLLGIKDALDSEARIAGRRAGLAGYSPSLNPHLPGTSEAIEWEQGRLGGANQRASDRAHRLALVSPCRYTKGHSCDCGGRGMCLDAA